MLNEPRNRSRVKPYSRLFFIEGPRSRCYGRNAAFKRKIMKMIMRFFFRFSILMKHRWNEIDRGKPKNSEKNLFQCHFVYHKSHMDRPGIEPGPPRWEFMAVTKTDNYLWKIDLCLILTKYSETKIQNNQHYSRFNSWKLRMYSMFCNTT